jgi:hypothetical protein
MKRPATVAESATVVAKLKSRRRRRPRSTASCRCVLRGRWQGARNDARGWAAATPGVSVERGVRIIMTSAGGGGLVASTKTGLFAR